MKLPKHLFRSINYYCFMGGRVGDLLSIFILWMTPRIFAISHQKASPSVLHGIPKVIKCHSNRVKRQTNAKLYIEMSSVGDLCLLYRFSPYILIVVIILMNYFYFIKHSLGFFVPCRFFVVSAYNIHIKIKIPS